MSINFEEDAKNNVPSSDQTKEISKLVRLVREQEQRVNKAKETLAREELRLKQLVEKELPDALQEAGVKSITTSEGVLVTIKEDIYASISKAHEQAALRWLVDNGFGSIIKSTVTLAFGRGEGENLDKVVHLLDENGFDKSVKEAVNANTLKALMREQLEAGKDVPEEVFGIFRLRQAIIK